MGASGGCGHVETQHREEEGIRGVVVTGTGTFHEYQIPVGSRAAHDLSFLTCLSCPVYLPFTHDWTYGGTTTPDTIPPAGTAAAKDVI